ncbi:MAG: serine/threonine protein phosphatase [Planctomycetaceae bacterium]|nr:serine/threonine protein phosphatase [Planctomycetaceae bacterium]
MRCLAVGDIHGCFDALQLLFQYAKIEDRDQVVFLGDYVDRGPDSARVIQFLIERLSVGNTVCLRGNHELMMENARLSLPSRQAWAMVGGDATWDSYSGLYKGEGLEAVPESHWDFLSRLAPYYETNENIFVHASIDAELDMADQFEDMLYWGSFSSIGPHHSGKKVICGHTSQKSGLPNNSGHAVCIDTWACGNGWLTCLDVHTLEYWQANQAGETRSSCLEKS